MTYFCPFQYSLRALNKNNPGELNYEHCDVYPFTCSGFSARKGLIAALDSTSEPSCVRQIKL